MRPRYFFALLGWLLALLVLPGPTRATELDLEAVIQLALERNPRYQEVLEVRREVEAGVQEARADAFPEVDLTSSWNRSRDPSFLTGADFEDILELFPGFEPQEQEVWSLAFEVRQALYSSGKVRAGIEAARLVVDLAEARIEQARLDTALDASEAFFEVQAARRSLAEVRRQEAARRESLAVVEARYELGEATELERLRAVASLAAVAPEVARYQGALTVALGRLRRVLSLAPGDPLEIVAAAELTGIDVAESPRPIEELLELAWQHRPELRDLRLQDDLLEQQQTERRADGRPQLELTGRFGRRGRDAGDLGDSLFDDWRVGLGFSWSLFDGGRRREQIAQLESQKTQLAWQLEALENEIAFEISTARSTLETARLQFAAAAAAADASREATRVARESYREGVALQADLLAAEEQEIEAELQRIEAARLARSEEARLHRATGRMLPTAGEATAGDTEGGEAAPAESSAASASMPPDLRGPLLHDKRALRCPASSRRVAEALPSFPPESGRETRMARHEEARHAEARHEGSRHGETRPVALPEMGRSPFFCPFGSLMEK